MKKLFLALITLLFLYTPAHATALTGPQCEATSEINEIEVGHKYMGHGDGTEYPDRVSYVTTIVTFTVQQTDCDFLAAGQTYKTNGGSQVDNLKPAQIVRMGAEMGSAPTRDGVVNFIHWSPVTIIKPKNSTPLPAAFHLQSNTTPVVKEEE